MAPKTDKKARISVLERRLQNPFGSPSTTVELKESGWTVRVFNSAITNDKIWRAKNDGWSVIMPDDVVDLDQIGGYGIAASGGHLVRGERGQEVFMKMRTKDYQAIQWAKARVNLERMGNPKKAKQDVVRAAERDLGEQSAEFMHKHVGPVGGVTDSYERIERRDE